MRIEYGHDLDFADVLIRPKRSTIGSRADVDITRAFQFLHSGARWEGFPIIASNMDTIGTFGMARAFVGFGALVALHKHYKRKDIVEFFKDECPQNVFYTLGIAQEEIDNLNYVKTKIPITKINIDVANGYTETLLQVVSRIRDENAGATIMAGTVVTAEMAEALILAGADIVRVGIGSGSVCTTRDVTGVGYPQLSAVIECADAVHGLKGHVCSDGGCLVPGDIAKALGGGSDFVMLGRMLAGHRECEGEVTYENRGDQKIPVTMTFYGMSSKTAMDKHHGGVAEYRAAEGTAVEVPYRGKVSATMQEIAGGIRSMMTYIGAGQLREVPQRTTFIVVNSKIGHGGRSISIGSEK